MPDHYAPEDQTDETPPRDTGDRLVMIARTLTPAVWAALVMLLAEWGLDMSWLTDRPATLMVAQALLTGVIYLVGIAAGRWAPWAERLLLSSAQRPTRYVDPSRADADREA